MQHNNPNHKKLPWYQEVLLHFCILNILVFISNVFISIYKDNSALTPITPQIQLHHLNTTLSIISEKSQEESEKGEEESITTPINAPKSDNVWGIFKQQIQKQKPINQLYEAKELYEKQPEELIQIIDLNYNKFMNKMSRQYTMNGAVGVHELSNDIYDSFIKTFAHFNKKSSQPDLTSSLISWNKSFFNSKIADILWYAQYNAPVLRNTSKIIALITNVTIPDTLNKFEILKIFNQLQQHYSSVVQEDQNRLRANKNLHPQSVQYRDYLSKHIEIINHAFSHFVFILCIAYEKGVQLYDIIKAMKAKITQNGTINDSDFNNYMQQIRDLKFIINDMSYNYYLRESVGNSLNSSYNTLDKA